MSVSTADLALYVKLLEIAYHGVDKAIDFMRESGLSDEEIDGILSTARGQFTKHYPDPKAPATPPSGEPPAPPPQAAVYGAVLDAKPDDAILRSGSQVFYRGDGKWFVWTIGVFVDPEGLGFTLHHIVE